MEYFKLLLEDDKKVVDLYVSSINDDIKSVETLEEEELKKNVEQLYEIFSLDVDFNKDFEKLTEIFKDFENSETYKNLSDRKSPKLKPRVSYPLNQYFLSSQP